MQCLKESVVLESWLGCGWHPCRPWTPRSWGKKAKSEAIFIWAASGTIFRELAPPSIGLDPIKPCTLIFPMGFGALIQIGGINTVQRVANTAWPRQPKPWPECYEGWSWSWVMIALPSPADKRPCLMPMCPCPCGSGVGWRQNEPKIEESSEKNHNGWAEGNTHDLLSPLMVRLGSKDSANKIQAASKSLNLLFKGPLYDVLSSRLLSWYMARAD